MSLEFKKTKIVFSGIISAEEAEPLLNWLIKKPAAKLDLSACTHLHAAILQVVLAAGATIALWPQDDRLRLWLQSAFEQEEEHNG